MIQQIPYEISGGFLGLAFVFAGGFSYFAWWMTTLVREQRSLSDQVARQTATLTDALSRIETHLATPRARPAFVTSTRHQEKGIRHRSHHSRRGAVSVAGRHPNRDLWFIAPTAPSSPIGVTSTA